MDAKTLEALKASIEKWKRNAAAEKPELYLTSAYDCPLCALFLDEGAGCKGCPVSASTGKKHCNGTPYIKAYIDRGRWAMGTGRADTAHEHARAEVAFLESLLPEGERP